MPKVRNRVKETTLTAGSGNISLAGPVNGFQAFGNVLSSGDTTYYTIVNKSNWEVGQGTYAPNILSRDVVFSSSNSGQKVNLSGKSDVFIAYPAEKSVFNNENDQTVVGLNGIVFADSSVQTSAYTDEKAQDAISSLLVAGTGIELNYNDSGNALSINAYGILPTGGSAGQILSKIDAANYNTEWIDNYAKEVVQYAKNSTHTSLSKGQVVYINGADGTNPTIALAIASGESTSSKTLGFLKQDLNHGDLGYVVTEGFLDGLNTNAAATEGDPIWLSPSVSGGVVYGLANKPYAPNHLVFLGYVIRKQINNGRIYVKIQNGFELSELHDVVAKTPNDGDIIRYVASSGLWSAQPMPVGYTDENAQDAVGGIVQNSSNVSLSYNDNTPSLIADLVDTTVASGVYGSVNQVGTFTVDAKGRLTQASNVTITPSGIGALGSLNGLTGSTQTFATGTSGTDFNIVSSGTAHTFNLPDVSNVARGLIRNVTVTNQSWTFYMNGSSDVIFSQSNVPDVWGVNVRLGGFHVANDTRLVRDAANTWNVRNFTNSQIFRISNTYTDASNYERLALQFGTYSSARYAQLATESAGTGTANINLVLTPKGTGAFILGPPPDGTVTGGNARGANSVDLRTATRNAATDVASGARSFTGPNGRGATGVGAVALGGRLASGEGSASFGDPNDVTGNTATGLYSTVICGWYSVAAGAYSLAGGGSAATSNSYAVALGNNVTASGYASLATGQCAAANRYGMRAHSSIGFPLGTGDCQAVELVLAGRTTTNAAVSLRLDGVGGTNILTIASGQICQYLLIITGVRQGGSQVATYMRKVCIKNIGGTTSLVGNVETIGTDLAIGTSLNIVADNTNKSLDIQVTGVLNQNWRWHCVAYGGEIKHE